MVNSGREYWSPEEDERLRQAVAKHGERWPKVASEVNIDRQPKQCRERWLNYLRPGIRRGRWLPSEEQLLHTLHSEHGNRWTKIARIINRSENDVKNHAYNFLKLGNPHCARESWSQQQQHPEAEADVETSAMSQSQHLVGAASNMTSSPSKTTIAEPDSANFSGLTDTGISSDEIPLQESSISPSSSRLASIQSEASDRKQSSKRAATSVQEKSSVSSKRVRPTQMIDEPSLPSATPSPAHVYLNAAHEHGVEASQDGHFIAKFLCPYTHRSYFLGIFATKEEAITMLNQAISRYSDS